MNKIGIDVKTSDAQKLISALWKLDGIVETVVNGGAYREDPYHCQVHLETIWTEEQVETWLYESSPVDYVGTFPR